MSYKTIQNKQPKLRYSLQHNVSHRRINACPTNLTVIYSHLSQKAHFTVGMQYEHSMGDVFVNIPRYSNGTWSMVYYIGQLPNWNYIPIDTLIKQHPVVFIQWKVEAKNIRTIQQIFKVSLTVSWKQIVF